jgi:hypothetical protein
MHFPIHYGYRNMEMPETPYPIRNYMDYYHHVVSVYPECHDEAKRVFEHIGESERNRIPGTRDFLFGSANRATKQHRQARDVFRLIMCVNDSDKPTGSGSFPPMSSLNL